MRRSCSHIPWRVFAAISAPNSCGNILVEMRVDKARDISCWFGWACAVDDFRPCEVNVMTGWYAERTPGRSARAVIAVTLLALLLVAVVPVALLAAVVMMLLGHGVGGLTLFGGSVLAAVVAVAFAGMTGMRRLRKLLSRASLQVVQLDRSEDADMAEPQGSDYTDVVQLDPTEYTEVG
jgi:hypothetical protein